MKKILLFGTLVGVLFSSCGTSPRGELVGVQDLEEFYPTEPYGMVYIPRGTYTMGANDGMSLMHNHSKETSYDAFFLYGSN